MDRYDTAAIIAWIESATSPHLESAAVYAQGYLARIQQNDVKQSLTIWQPLLDEPERLSLVVRGRFLMSVGISYTELNQFDRALYYFQRSAAVHQENGVMMDVAAVHINMMGLHFYTQAYEDVLLVAEQVTQMLQTMPLSKKRGLYLGATYNQHALACIELEQYEDAEVLLKRCLALQETAGSARTNAFIHDNLALIAERQGRWETAESHYQIAIQCHEAANNLRGTVVPYYHLGLIALHERNNPTVAQTHLSRGLMLAKQMQHDEFITRLHLAMAEQCEMCNDGAGALRETEAAVNAAERLRANIVLPDDRAKMMSARIDAYEQMVERLCRAERWADAFHVIEMCKSRVLVELLADKPLRRPQNVPAAWLDQEQTLREQLQMLYQADNDPTQIDQLETQLAHLREQIRIQDAEFGSFSTVDPLPLDEVQAQLPNGAVLIAYFAAGERLMAFTITADHITYTPLTLTLPQLKRAFTTVADDRLGALHGLLPTADAQLQEPWMLRRLYDFLIAPLGDVIETAETLVIIPHNILHYVPFHALYRDDHVYLNTRNGEARPVIYAPSATVLLDYCQTKPLSTQTGCLALGSNGDNTIQLTHAEAEAEGVVATIGGTAYVGTEAVCERLIEMGKQYRYIHLSCHGWFNPVWPLSSSLSLADGTLDVVDVLRDVVLEAELVSLSACETGRHAILKGDELVGLTRAFLYAGTPAVLVSQWVVDEVSTRLLMTHFYEQIASGQTIAAALSIAQQFIRTLTIGQIYTLLPELTTLSNSNMDGESRPFSHPYYWASFFLSGGRLF